MQWIALYLPQLALESFMASVPSCPQACALIDAHRVVQASAAAQALGVHPGIKRSTALALVPELFVGKPDSTRDAQALLGVAHVALAFTPSVTMDLVQTQAQIQTQTQTQTQLRPHRDGGSDAWRLATVWLEVRASLRYFGGLPRLCARLQQALQALGHQVHWGLAPTPEGAAALARWEGAPRGDLPGPWAPDLPTLQAWLDQAPAALFMHSTQSLSRLHEMGLNTVAALRHQPRAGVSRRLGPQCLETLDRARGQRPDPRDWLRPSERFEQAIELPMRADAAEHLLQGAQLLMSQLAAWAQARHVRVQRFTLGLQHETRQRKRDDSPARSELALALAEPSADPAHWMSLLRERLVRWDLPAPTVGLNLRCDAWVAGPAPPADLFPSPQTQGEGLTRLIERLQARLGEQGVQSLQAVADYRPERSMQPHSAEPAAGAYRAVPQGAATFGVPSEGGARGGVEGLSSPVWLIEPPQPLVERQGRPCWQGRPLRLLSGPQRIEAGWWDGALAQRDYFIAQTSDGSLLWLYRGRCPPMLPTALPAALGHDGAAATAAERTAEKVAEGAAERAAHRATWAQAHPEPAGWFLQGRFA